MVDTVQTGKVEVSLEVDFYQLVRNCAQILDDLDQEHLRTAIEYFNEEIGLDASFLIDAEAFLACLIAHNILRPNNIYPLLKVAELTGKTTIKSSVDLFLSNIPSVLQLESNKIMRNSSHSKGVNGQNLLVDNGLPLEMNFLISFFFNIPIFIFSIVFRMVSEDLQADWRILARELGVAERDVCRIQNAHISDYPAATIEMLHFTFPKTSLHAQDHLFRRLIIALEAIKRNSLASKISALVSC